MTSSLVGSEMCIRDRHITLNARGPGSDHSSWKDDKGTKMMKGYPTTSNYCLLYTSDAADDM
eukprot:10173323-Prorocentrum_lima.AAC.1